MSNAEFFNPSEGGESYDPAAFERFKDQMKKSAAFMAAARKGEQKQKQKEDRLAKILLRFIQTNQKSDIVMLAARLLEENIPASVILAIIILGNEELKEEVKQNVPLLEVADAPPAETSPTAHEFSLMNRFSDSSLPLKIKAEIDEWGKGIFEAASASPFRVLETALGADGNVKKIVIACAANVLSSFMESQQTELKADYEAFLSFCELLVQAIMKKIKEQVSNQKELQGEP